jgi:hypothetical protein
MFHFAPILLKIHFAAGQPKNLQFLSGQPFRNGAASLARYHGAPIHGHALHALQRFF